MTQTRTQKGVPTGGQFAAGAHDEAEVNLVSVEVSDEVASEWGRTGIGVGSYSPWGRVDQTHEQAPGITIVFTPGHGGTRLSAERNAVIPPGARNDEGWYEEDCEWAIPAMVHPGAYTPEQVAEAVRVSRDYNPDAYEAITGEKVASGESWQRDREAFYDHHAKSMLTTSATGYENASGEDMVLVTAQVGGRSKHAQDGTTAVFIVPSEEYRKRETNPDQCFVVDTDLYPAMTVRQGEIVSTKADIRRYDRMTLAAKPGRERIAAYDALKAARGRLTRLDSVERYGI